MYMLTFITTLLNILWAGNFTNVPCLPRFWGWAKLKMREEREKKLWNESGLRDLPAFTNAIISSNIVPSDLGSIQGLLMTTKKSYLQKKNKEKGRLVKITSQLSLKWSDSLGKTVGGNLNKIHANVIRSEWTLYF